MQEEKKRHITFRYLLGNFIAEKAAKQRKIKEGKKVNMSTCCPLLNKLSLKNEARLKKKNMFKDSKASIFHSILGKVNGHSLRADVEKTGAVESEMDTHK